jgi:molybdopterin converting factor small subunit
MQISLRCFSKLSESDVCDFRGGDERELSEGDTVESLIDKLGFQQDDIKLIFVNGEIVGFDKVLKDGDRVGLAPPQLGM